MMKNTQIDIIFGIRLLNFRNLFITETIFSILKAYPITKPTILIRISPAVSALFIRSLTDLSGFAFVCRSCTLSDSYILISEFVVDVMGLSGVTAA